MMRNTVAILSVLLTLIGVSACRLAPGPESDAGSEAERGAGDGLPRVLIVGDSISLGYTPRVKEMLAGRAVVKHNRGNAQHTGTGLLKLEEWIGQEEWDVIHFNWGLWDLCYRNPESKVQGNRDKVHGTLTTSLDQYGKNLEELVRALKKTGATLIWANTTVIPEGEAGRIVGDAAKYNAVAETIMKKYGVRINDLYSTTKKFPASFFTAPGNVHYTSEGYGVLARQVVGEIEKAF